MSVSCTCTEVVISPPRISYRCWEGETYIITVDGRPTGGTIANEHEARIISKWLRENEKHVMKVEVKR